MVLVEVLLWVFWVAARVLILLSTLGPFFKPQRSVCGTTVPKRYPHRRCAVRDRLIYHIFGYTYPWYEMPHTLVFGPMHRADLVVVALLHFE